MKCFVLKDGAFFLKTFRTDWRFAETNLFDLFNQQATARTRKM